MSDIDNVAASAIASESASASESSVASSALSSLEKVASAESTSSAQTGVPAASTPADVKSPPVNPAQVPAATVQGDDTNNGPIPFDRHKTILENTRTKVAADTEAALRTKLGWAEKYGNPQEVDEAMELFNEFRRDPAGFVRAVQAELQPAQQEEELTDPEADLISEDGKKAYSDRAVSKLVSNAIARLERKLTGQLKPMSEFVNGERKQRELSNIVEQNRQIARDAITDISTMPHFTENKAAIAEVMQAMDPAIKQRIGAVAALHRAYNIVLRDKVFPGIQQRSAEEVRNENLRKANATNGDVRPGGKVGTQTVKLKDGDVEGLAAHMRRMAESQGVV